MDTGSVWREVARRTVVALAAVEPDAKLVRSARRRQYPRPVLPRRVVADVLIVTAGEFGDPVVFNIEVEGGDGLLHVQWRLVMPPVLATT